MCVLASYAGLPLPLPYASCKVLNLLLSFFPCYCRRVGKGEGEELRPGYKAVCGGGVVVVCVWGGGGRGGISPLQGRGGSCTASNLKCQITVFP